MEDVHDRAVPSADRAPVVLPGRVRHGHVLEPERLGKRPHVAAGEEAREEHTIDRRQVPKEERLPLRNEILRSGFLARLGGVHLVPLCVASQHAVVHVPDQPLVRTEDIDVLHRDVSVRPLREDCVARGADGYVAQPRVRNAADHKGIVADIQPRVLHTEVRTAARDAVRAHHGRERLHVP